jgi:hypothetical protein
MKSLFSVGAFIVLTCSVLGAQISNVPPEFAFIYRVGVPPASVPELWKALPYDSVALERSTCMAGCPAYKVTLHKGSNDRSGRAELHVSRPSRPGTRGFAEKSGDYVGSLDIKDYGRLNYLLVQSKFASFSSTYPPLGTEARRFTVTTTAGNVTKQVSNEGSVAPIELWAIEQAIDSIAQGISWAPK